MEVPAALVRRALRALGARLFHWAENNGDCDARSNGEHWLVRSSMRRWAQRTRGRRVVLDVGANEGDYTALVLMEATRAGVEVRVLAIEPSTACAARLRERFRGDGRVEVIEAALGDAPGRGRLRDAGSAHASFVRGDATVAAEEVTVERLDALLGCRGITHVDLLKLDVEGAEFAALRGAGELLDPEVTGCIQFEYGGTTLAAGATLEALYRLLEGRGFAVGKLMPHAVDVRPFAGWMEHFAYANFVALGRYDVP